MKPKFIDYYMKIAEVTAGLSYAKRLNVGAVIVKENQILGTGYNGMPSGWENNCEIEVFQQDGTTGLKTKPEVLHAETNAIAKVAQSTESSHGSTLFCTHAPCIDCAKLIYQSGINTVYYRDQYRSDDGIKFLQLSGVNVHQHSNSI
jgi:dCMP deaminase